jgi:hypothetical protein
MERGTFSKHVHRLAGYMCPFWAVDPFMPNGVTENCLLEGVLWRLIPSAVCTRAAPSMNKHIEAHFVKQRTF